jgi:hypothetical protein
MKLVKLLVLAGAVAVAAFGVWSARAAFTGRQYYDAWRSSGKGYYFSVHHYKPSRDAAGYLTNYAVWHPSLPRYVYYYNPAKKTYWGRYNVQTKGYSLLAEKDRTGRLRDIPDKAFPPEGELPQVPEAKDKLTLEVPPDLPPGEKPGVTATADKPDDKDLTQPPATEGKDPPPDVPPEKPGAGTGATPDKPGTNPPAVPAAGGKTDPGVVAPPESFNPPPATAGTGGAAVGGKVPPATTTPAPANGPVFPGYPGNCNKKFGGCPGYGRPW